VEHFDQVSGSAETVHKGEIFSYFVTQFLVYCAIAIQASVRDRQEIAVSIECHAR
jgi:hypothetical protein